jgi:hypothetical protein
MWLLPALTTGPMEGRRTAIDTLPKEVYSSISGGLVADERLVAEGDLPR